MIFSSFWYQVIVGLGSPSAIQLRVSGSFFLKNLSCGPSTMRGFGRLGWEPGPRCDAGSGLATPEKRRGIKLCIIQIQKYSSEKEH